jgi:predicted nucleotidyltransferase
LGVFGSYVCGDATTSSDLDVLVEFQENARLTLFWGTVQEDIPKLIEQLERIFGGD